MHLSNDGQTKVRAIFTADQQTFLEVFRWSDYEGSWVWVADFDGPDQLDRYVPLETLYEFAEP